MRIFALQTNINALRKLYLIEGERELLVSHYHWVVFFIHLLKRILIFVGLLFLITIIIQLSGYSFIYTTIALVILAIATIFTCINAYIRYRYNYIIVTTEKVVCINQTSFFNQQINPTHLDAIVSTDVLSQLYGFFGCGKLVINLAERTQYSSKQIEMNYIQEPNTIAGVIENAIVLDKQRAHANMRIEEQQREIEALQRQARPLNDEEPISHPTEQ